MKTPGDVHQDRVDHGDEDAVMPSGSATGAVGEYGRRFLQEHGPPRAEETLREIDDRVERTDVTERYEAVLRPERYSPIGRPPGME